MAASSTLVLPSLEEGFGLPVAEAMAAGLPVVCSRGSALEEVAGGAATLVNPLDTRSIADGIERVLDDPRAGRAQRRRGPRAEPAVRLGHHRRARRSTSTARVAVGCRTGPTAHCGSASTRASCRAGRPGTGRYLRNLLRAWPRGQRRHASSRTSTATLPADAVLDHPRVVAARAGPRAAAASLWQERRLPARRARATRSTCSSRPAYTCPLAPRRAARDDRARPLVLRAARTTSAWPRRPAPAPRWSRRACAPRRAVLACLGVHAPRDRAAVPRRGRARGARPARRRRRPARLPPRDEARAPARRCAGPLLLTVGPIFNRRRLPVLLRAVARLRPPPSAASRWRSSARTARPSAARPGPALATRWASRDRVRFTGFVERGGARRPLRRRGRRGVPLRLRGLRPARAGGDGARRPRRGQPTGPPSARSSARRAARGSARGRAGDRGRRSAACSRTTALRADLVARGRDAGRAPFLGGHGGAADARGARSPRRARRRMSAPRVSVGRRLLQHARRPRCAAWRRSTRTVRARLEVVVVDNASTDGSADAGARDFPAARVIAQRREPGLRPREQPGRSRPRSGAYVLFLNSDARCARARLTALPRVLDRPAGVGIVGPRTAQRRTARPRSRSAPRSTPLAEWRQRRPRARRARGATRPRCARAEALAAARVRARLGLGGVPASWRRRAALDAVGGFDEALLPLRGGRRPLRARCARAGWRVALHAGGRGRPSPRPQHGTKRRIARGSSTTAATCLTTASTTAPLPRRCCAPASRPTRSPPGSARPSRATRRAESPMRRRCGWPSAAWTRKKGVAGSLPLMLCPCGT